MPDTITANHTVAIEDVEYQKGMLARLYRPSGAGPFPAALQVHGGAYTSKDRDDNDFMAKARRPVQWPTPNTRTRSWY